MTQDEKKTIYKKIDEVLKQRTGDAPIDFSQPFLEGDVVTFKVPESGDVSDLLVHHKETKDKNGQLRKEYFAVKTAEGREVSQTHLVKRRGNGVPAQGDTPDERLKDFLSIVADMGTLSLIITKIRILPSTNPNWNSQRIYTWGMAA